jgi:hypothetical protein
MPNTARGLPYPVPTDPVAQGAAAIQALAAALDARQQVAILRRAAPLVGLGPGGAYVPWDTETRDDPGCLTPGQDTIHLPEAGAWFYTVCVMFGTASGDGGVSARAELWSAAPALIRLLTRGEGFMNGSVTLSGIVLPTDATSSLRVKVDQGATGHGHDLVQGEAAVMRLGP